MNVTSHLEYSLVTKARDQEVKLLVRLKAPEASARTRRPLNLCVVIDRSGSMSGDKIENTRRALKTLITHLDADDFLSVVQFDDEAQVLLEPTHVRNKDALKRLVDRIDTGGSTNLSGGWLLGLDLLGQQAGEGTISRCLLLTDGQANQGIQDPTALAAIGQEARRSRGIVTTTLGFGAGFNEDLLVGIARESGGAFYFVDQAEQAPAIFNEELQGLLRLAAQNVEVRVRPQGLVRLMAQWTDYPGRVLPDGVAFALGDLYAGETKDVLMSLFVPGLPEMPAVTLAQLEVSFAEIDGSAVTVKQIAQQVTVRVAGEGESAEPDIVVLQQYGLQMAAKGRKKAIQEADGGDYAKAERTLRTVAEKLAGLPDSDRLLAREIEDLRTQAGQFDSGVYQSYSRKVLRETAFNASMGRQEKVASSRARRQRDTTNPSGRTT